MADAYQISKAIRDRLQITDPELSTELGTPVRKVIDAVAESLAEVSLDSYMSSYLFDLDAYSGTDLDAFVALFGFARQRPKAASGTLTLERDNADSVLTIRPGAQFYKPATASTPMVRFQTTAFATMQEGETSVDVPIRAVVEGSDGNVAANTITGIGSSINVSRVYNALPTTGGVDAENDAQLRSRFRATVFRNVAGTKDQYLGLCLAHALVTRANVIGQTSLFSEILTMTDLGDGMPEADSTNAEVQALIDAEDGVWLYDIEGVDHGGTPAFYTEGATGDFTVSESGGVVTVKSNAGPTVTDGAIVRFEYEFLSTANRNDAVDGTGDYPRAVEIMVDGEDSVTVTAELYLNKSVVFDNAGGDMDVDNWVRLDDTTTPSVNNVFVPLPYQPVLGLPDSISFGSSISVDEDAGYYFVRDVTAWRGSHRARDGIEFVVGASSPNGIDDVSDGVQFQVTYTWNRVPQALQDLIEQHRQVPADALVHAAKKRYFSPQLVVMYSTFPTSSVDALIEDAIEDYFNSLPFGSWVQLNDIEAVVHAVPGVDAVRFVESGDVGTMAYGLKEYASDGTTDLTDGVTKNPYTGDFKLRSDEIGVLHSVVILNRTQEQWV